jgi:hypothetical protein
MAEPAGPMSHAPQPEDSEPGRWLQEQAPSSIIRIDLGNRYLGVITCDLKLTADAVQRLRHMWIQGLTDWLKSGEQFGVIVLDAGLEFKVYRVDTPLGGENP